MNKETQINKLLDNINGFPLDNLQRQVVTSKTKHLLVSAGAGSGKTLTIIGKIRYLIEIEKLKEEEIICISFTNEATNNLKEKLKQNYNYNIPCYTFHKLGLEILKNEKYKISTDNLLTYTINEYFKALINKTPQNKKRVLSFLKIKYNSLNYEKQYTNLTEKELSQVKNIIEKFINLFKANDFQNQEFINFTKKWKKENKQKLHNFNLLHLSHLPKRTRIKKRNRF